MAYPDYYPQPGQYAPTSYPPAMQPQPMQRPVQMRGGEFICRAVGSPQEAQQIPVDYTAPMLLPDLEHDAIYLKVFNPATGSSVLTAFLRQQPAPPVEYATTQALEDLRAEVERLRGELGGKKAVAK